MYEKESVHESDNKPVLAVFDFDKTMSDRHSFWRFLRFVAGPWRFYSAIFVLFPTIIQYYFKKITLMQLREVVIRYFLANITEGEFQARALRFSQEYLPKWISKAALRRLKWHQDQGHFTALVSNAPEVYLQFWARSAGFDEVIGSKFEVRDGLVTGRLVGEHCFGMEKVNRLQTAKGPLDQYCIYMYGDSEGDREMLALAQFPFYRVFNKDQSAIEPFGRE